MHINMATMIGKLTVVETGVQGTMEVVRVGGWLRGHGGVEAWTEDPWHWCYRCFVAN